MDRTSVRIVALLIAAGGIVTAVTKAGVPGTDLTFWGANPFIAKQITIETVHAWVFAGVGLVGVLVELVSEITERPKNERVHSTWFYIAVTASSAVLLVVSLSFLNLSTGWLARKSWESAAIEEMREAFDNARFIVEHDGWRSDQWEAKANVTDSDLYRNANFESARRTVHQIETLFEVQPDTADLPLRITQLERFFGVR